MEKYRVFNTKNRILALILVVVMSFQLVSNYIPGSYAANEPVVLNMASVSQDVYIYTRCVDKKKNFLDTRLSMMGRFRT